MTIYTISEQIAYDNILSAIKRYKKYVVKHYYRSKVKLFWLRVEIAEGYRFRKNVSCYTPLEYLSSIYGEPPIDKPFSGRFHKFGQYIRDFFLRI